MLHLTFFFLSLRVHAAFLTFYLYTPKLLLRLQPHKTVALNISVWERTERKVRCCRIESQVKLEYLEVLRNGVSCNQLTGLEPSLCHGRQGESHRSRGAAPRQPSAGMIRDSGGKRM